MKKHPFLIILAIIVLMKFHAFGQTTWQGSKNKNHNFTLSGFGDLYYGKHVGNYAKKESFYYNHKVNDKIRTNLLLLKGEFTSPRFHATLGLMTGDIMCKTSVIRLSMDSTARSLITAYALSANSDPPGAPPQFMRQRTLFLISGCSTSKVMTSGVPLL